MIDKLCMQSISAHVLKHHPYLIDWPVGSSSSRCYGSELYARFCRWSAVLTNVPLHNLGKQGLSLKHKANMVKTLRIPISDFVMVSKRRFCYA